MSITLRLIVSAGVSVAALYWFPLSVGQAASFEVRAGDLVRVVPPDLSVALHDLRVRIGSAEPDPDNDSVLVVVQAMTPRLFAVFAALSLLAPGLVFFIGSSVAESVGSVWLRSLLLRRTRGKLPPWPLDPKADGPAICIGEVHHKLKMVEAPHPRWLVMPEKGLFTGLAIFGAIGTGKTTSCMKPFCEQLLEWQAGDEEKRVAMLVLEVKGDFCYAVQEMLEKQGRMGDYMELTMSPASRYAYQWNPLNAPWLDTYSLAYTIASLVNQLFGKSKEPFWQQAYTNVIRWIIAACRSFPDPWFTFKDIYVCMLDKKELAALLDRQTSYVYGKYTYEFHISDVDYQADRDRFDRIVVTQEDVDESIENAGQPLAGGGVTRALGRRCVNPDGSPRTYEFKWELQGAHRVAVLRDTEYMVMLREVCKPGSEVKYGLIDLTEPPEEELALNKEINRWYHEDWLGLDEKLRSSIVEGMSVFLGIFVVPEVARVFCPKSPKEMTPKERARLMPPLDEAIEDGKVLALNMPAGTNPALARAAGVMLKTSWLSTLLLRPQRMAEAPKGKFWRPAVFVCDEYQTFVTAGEDDPGGDEKAFALTRQSRCIPIVATQSISSLKSVLGEGEAWRALLQTLRSRIFLSLADDFSQKTASELLGQVTRMAASYSISENTGKASASLLTGRMGGGTASAGVSKSFQERREALFHPRDLSLLGTCQAVAQIFDGAAVRDATRVYLKPTYRPRSEPYWEWYRKELAPDREAA